MRLRQRRSKFHANICIPIYLIAMETAGGDLGDYCIHNHASILGVDSIERVIRSLLAQVECLRRNKLCCTDIKTQNVLYTLTDKKNKHSLRVLLGDLGSVDGACSDVCPFSLDTLYPNCSCDGRFFRSDLKHFVHDTIISTFSALADVCKDWPSASVWQSMSQFKPI